MEAVSSPTSASATHRVARFLLEMTLRRGVLDMTVTTILMCFVSGMRSMTLTKRWSFSFLDMYIHIGMAVFEGEKDELN